MKRLAVIAVVVSACGGSSKPAVERPDDVEPDVAVREARDLIEEAYASLRRGDAEGLLPLLAPEVFIIGPRATDVLPAGSDALVALGDALDDVKVKKGHKLKSRDLQVVASTGGHSAWATDQLEVDGGTYAMTAVLTHEDDLWTFRAVHLARTWKPKQLAKQEPAPGAAFGDRIDPAGKELLVLAQDAIEDLDEREAQLPDDESDASFDVVVVSTAPKGATHGVKKIKKAWKKARKKQEPPPTEPVGPAAFGITDDGALAWVCANVETDGVPHRMFLLYARDDDWRLMALQDAALVQ